MQPGSIGDVEFTVSEQDVFTFGAMTCKREVSFAEHAVMDGMPRLQHTGRKLDTISLPIVIDASRPGSVPFSSRFASLMALAGEGKDVPLVFGSNYIRQWVVLSVNLTATVQHGPVILRGSITLELTEYN